MASTETLEDRIDAVRIALKTETEFSRVVDLYERTLAEYAPLRDASRQARDEIIEQSVAEGVTAVLGTDDPVVLLLFRVPGHGMWHGFTLSGGTAGLFFGFDASSQICLCMTRGGKSHYLRITWTETPLPKRRVRRGAA